MDTNNVWDSLGNLFSGAADAYAKVKAANTTKSAPAGDPAYSGTNIMPGLFGPYPQNQDKPRPGQGPLSFLQSGGAQMLLFGLALALLAFKFIRK